MAPLWISDSYKSLDISRTQGAPHDMPEKFIEWLPKFFGTSVTSARDHVGMFMASLDAYGTNEHEDVVLNFFSKSIEGYVKLWFIRLPRKSIKGWNDLMKVFMNTQEVKIDVKLLLNALFDIRKRENETMS